MSRNRNRGRRAPESVPAAQAATAPVAAPAHRFSRPVKVLVERATIDDYVLVMEFQEVARTTNDEQQISLAVVRRFREVHALLDRMIEGGVGGRPLIEFMPLMGEVMKAFLGTGNQGN